jgi:hypothetical protein
VNLHHAHHDQNDREQQDHEAETNGWIHIKGALREWVAENQGGALSKPPIVACYGAPAVEKPPLLVKTFGLDANS